MVRITDSLEIPGEELELTASRSGGPGGQKVNKVSTRVMLRFDVAWSPHLTDWQRGQILSRLRNRITKEGVLVLSCQEHRTQAANRSAAVERFAALLREALRQRRKRKKTSVPAATKRRRLEEKKRRSRLKRTRSAAEREE